MELNLEDVLWGKPKPREKAIAKLISKRTDTDNPRPQEAKRGECEHGL